MWAYFSQSFKDILHDSKFVEVVFNTETKNYTVISALMRARTKDIGLLRRKKNWFIDKGLL